MRHLGGASARTLTVAALASRPQLALQPLIALLPPLDHIIISMLRGSQVRSSKDNYGLYSADDYEDAERASGRWCSRLPPASEFYLGSAPCFKFAIFFVGRLLTAWAVEAMPPHVARGTEETATMEGLEIAVSLMLAGGRAGMELAALAGERVRRLL